MKSGHSVWAKYRQASEVIDLDGLFDDYWSSSTDEFTVLSQSLSPGSPRRSDQMDRGYCDWKVQWLSGYTILFQ